MHGTGRGRTGRTLRLLPWVLVAAAWCAALGPAARAGAPDTAAAPGPAAVAPAPAEEPATQGGALARLWRRDLFTVGGAPVRVSQVVVALLVLVVGFWASRGLTHVLRVRVLSRSRFDASAAAAVEKVLFYILLAVVMLFAFQALRIPTTVFTFLGGALAIGLGFGAQNIINNFISGLILMFERPIRIGDLVEVDAHRGSVEEIRFRCTRIRSTDGIDVLVPNSALLEKSVINWTLSDKRLRTSVAVGVIYGSPTELVARLIRQAVDEHPRVLQEPEPVIVFQDFGDNALAFEVFFWTEIKTAMDLRVVCSDIRFRIDALFREHDLVIAFPQRDVHLDTVRPLDVRVLPADGQAAGPQP